jgi:ABC-type Zn uptake system ZnuABC Zn-binding protein ZnuA
MRSRTKAGLAGLGTVVAAAGVLSLLCGGCGGGSNPWQGLGGPPRVVATIPPIDCFVQNVGGSYVGVLSLCTAQGPHEFDPNTDDKQKLQQADLFILNGLGLESRFAAKMADSTDNPKLRGLNAPGVINLGGKLIEAKLAEKFDENAPRDEDDEGEYDPHVWLGIPQAVKMVEVIRDALAKADPPHKADYERNAAEYVAKLKKLHEEGRDALKDKKNRKIVTTHDSMHYFAKSFGIEIEGYVQLQPGADPDEATIVKLVNACQRDGVTVIATEPQYPESRSAVTLARELQNNRGVKDVQIIPLDALETVGDKDTLDAGWYERRMRANIDELKKALR